MVFYGPMITLTLRVRLRRSLDPTQTLEDRYLPCPVRISRQSCLTCVVLPIIPLPCMLNHHFSKIGGVVVQSPLLAIREYEIEHGIPSNYINCLM